VDQQHEREAALLGQQEAETGRERHHEGDARLGHLPEVGEPRGKGQGGLFDRICRWDRVHESS
jgi:hypothetical protein